MKFFKNIQEKSGILTFELHTEKKVNKGLVNAIRRIIISKTPLIAIDIEQINFLKNTSILHNEMLTRRLSLIPWDYNALKKLDLSKLEIKLQSENKAEEIKDILVKDFELFNGEKKLDINQFTNFTNILFLKLKPFQDINLIAKFKESTQRNSGAAFCPTSTSIFTFGLDKKALDKALKDIPKDDQKDFLVENQERFYLTDDKGEPTVYDYTIESIGQLSNKMIFKNSFDILIQELDRLVKGLMESIPEIIHIDIPKISMVAFDFTIPNEDDTLGNLLQSYLLDDDNVNYAAYDIIHPLQKSLIIRMSLKNNNTLENNKTVFLSTITHIKKLVMELKKDFK